jgi:hypothetical protein
MARVLFMVSYAVKPERRNEYLARIKQIRDHFTNVEKKTYMVFEAKGKKNQFTEVFLAGSTEEFDALDEHQDEKIESLVSALEDMMEPGTKRYSTLIEPV